jgi:hypothetical protein
VKYPGYKQTAYLHPNHFKPDRGVLDALGVAPGERFFLLRLVDMVASHDGGESGVPAAVKQTLLARLRERGRVFITHEGELPAELQPLRFPLPPDKLHDALAFADLLIGDSATMAAEAAVLGTPNLHLSSWSGRLALLREIEERYGLMFAFRLGDAAGLLARLERWLAEPNLRQSLAGGHRRLLADNVDVAEWFTSFLLAGAPLPTLRHNNSQNDGGSLTNSTDRDVALIGAGHGGTNLARSFDALGALGVVCEANEATLASIKAQYPAVRTTTSLDEALSDPAVRKVAIAASRSIRPKRW